MDRQRPFFASDINIDEDGGLATRNSLTDEWVDHPDLWSEDEDDGGIFPATGPIWTNGQPLWIFRGDTNHGLEYDSDLNGLNISGYEGGALSTKQNAAAIPRLVWGVDGVDIVNGGLTVEGLAVVRSLIEGANVDVTDHGDGAIEVAVTGVDLAGTATAAVAAHVADVDPHGDRAYTDAQIADRITTAFDWKASVKVATTANITLSGTQTINGVSIGVGDRVLVKNQSTASQNGIYVAASGAWVRATDADTSAKVTGGMSVPVIGGTVDAGQQWMLTTPDPITLGTTALTFTKINAGTLVAALNLSDLTSPSAARGNLGLVIGTDVQAFSAVLATLVSNGTPGAAGLAVLLGSTNAAIRTTLGLGSAALSNTSDFAAAVHTHALSALSDVDVTTDLAVTDDVLAYNSVSGKWTPATLTMLTAGALAGKMSTLARTAVKTSVYTASADELVPCDTTSGGFQVNLPNAPADGALVAVKHIIQGSTNAVTIACSGADVFNRAAGATSFTLPLSSQGAVMHYAASPKIWTVIADDIPLSQLDSRFSRLIGGQGQGPNIVNTTTETSMLTSVIPLAAIATGELIKFEAAARYLQNSGANRLPTLRVKVGSTTLVTVTFTGNISVQTPDRTLFIQGYIRSLGSGSQTALCQMGCATESAANAPTIQGKTGTGTEAMQTAGLNFDMTWQHPVATATQECQLQSLNIWKVA